MGEHVRNNGVSADEQTPFELQKRSLCRIFVGKVLHDPPLQKNMVKTFKILPLRAGFFSWEENDKKVSGEKWGDVVR
ncbi:hypothetical protein HFA01_35640 [Halobacillus faecis]|uniref:Uncharacterized protein n=1 Tax=Halobacillus faecis TaxID=360184 RepID=A0A511WZ37_9BACI|nr:hypothetical protein HFA01_35640 [Halobacillus faecis]